MTYSLKEIIDIAVAIEQSGHEFYLSCAETFSNEKIKEIFSFLASEELEHKKKFQNMLPGIGTEQGLFTEEYYLYLKAIGSGTVFGEDPEERTAVIESEEAAVKKAFEDEKRSILFYSEIKELYGKGEPAVSILESIIQEERRHVATLMDVMQMVRLSKQ